jgi:hypothetical protein
MKTPNHLLYEYSTYIEEGGFNTYEDGELLDLIIEATKQKPSADGLPTDRQILMAINDALYHHFNEEDHPNG